MGTSYLDIVVAAQHRGQALGIASLCTANLRVLDVALRRAARRGERVLIESTCNQVNQFGGYTGMRPAHFVATVREMAQAAGLPHGHLILGGDHLGPNPWRDEPVESAMAKARELVAACVRAGYEKIHLDASMPCADDPRPLPPEVAAERAADLAQVAETAWGDRPGSGPRYVVGTEVPIPGGAQAEGEALHVTEVADAAATLDLTRRAFARRGLDGAWARVIALVVQPGVEFGSDSVHEYDRRAAEALSRFIEGTSLVYEAHSTDYQTRHALRQMVEDHFAILKVGPALTFALREALFALEMMEVELLPLTHLTEPSDLRAVVDAVMVAEPAAWQRYYGGDEAAQRFARRYSFSDRIRYYWPHPRIRAAIRRLMDNLAARPIPPTLASQYMPSAYRRIREAGAAITPQALIAAHIEAVLDDYAYATMPT